MTGFSQESMYTLYLGVCFADKVVGMWQGGSAMARNQYACPLGSPARKQHAPNLCTLD